MFVGLARRFDRCQAPLTPNVDDDGTNPMSLLPNLTNRVALVTGGSRGIGRAIVLALAESGADVAVNYRERGDDARVVADTVRAAGRRAITVGADVSDSAAVANMMQVIAAELGAVDVLVNNAGIA